MAKKSRKRKAASQEPVGISCHRCGHRHEYPSVEALDQTPSWTPCAQCGFFYLQYLKQKLDATLLLVASDPHAAALLQAGEVAAFARYLEEKTGLR
jgi:hypothetical protein